MWWCGGHAGLSWLGWTLMSLGMVAFWGLIVWAIVALVRRPQEADAALRPGDVLNGRLARGEITRDEYLRLRELLEDGTPHRDPSTSKEVVP